METRGAGACSGHRANHRCARAPATALSPGPRLCQEAAGLSRALLPTVGTRLPLWTAEGGRGKEGPAAQKGPSGIALQLTTERA